MPKDVLIELSQQMTIATKDFSKIINAVLKTKYNDDHIKSTIVYLGTFMNLTCYLAGEVKKLRDRVDELEKRPSLGFESKN